MSIEQMQATNNGDITKRECAAMRLLARDGWTADTLKMTFHLSRKHSVTYHVTGECAHSHSIQAVRSWSGQEPPDHRLSSEDRI